MANYFVPLAAQKPGPGLNLEPVNAALDGIIQQQNQKRQFGMQQQQIDQRQAEQTYQHGRDAKQDGMQQVQLFGKQATAVDQLQGPQRTAAWSSILARHGTTNLTPEELDPVTGPKLMAAQAGQFLDPLDREIKQVGLDLTRAQIKAADQKNTLNDAIAGLISGSGGPTGGTAVPPLPQNAPNRALQAQPAPATVQPQSFESTPTMPGVVLASDTSTVPGTPAAPPTTQPELIDTPLGRMTPQRARQLGMAFALGGKGDAGKMLSDSANSGDLSKGAMTQNDKEELGSTGQLATLNAIKQSYNSKYLNVPTRFQMWGTALKDKFGTLSDSDKKDLQGYATFRQASWHNLNRVLKDLSGTAVTENEMQRQLLDLPNPGQGVFDGDAPAEFEAKLKGSLAFAQSAIARARFLRNKGFAGKPWESGINVEDMPAVINQRGQEIEQEFRQQHPNASPMQLQQATTRKIKQEFGI